jgi:hypothetical protein
MSFYTLSQIRSLGNLANFAQKNLQRKSLSNKKTLFLSHSHEDRDIVEDAIAFLLTIGIYAYVDWLDPTMPKTTSGSTAQKIKERIQLCELFVVLLTENSRESKWVPWELGFADAKKRNQDISIFPIKRNYGTTDSNFDGLEYMQLYQRISLGNLRSTGQDIAAVFSPNTSEGTTLEGWLR